MRPISDASFFHFLYNRECVNFVLKKKTTPAAPTEKSLLGRAARLRAKDQETNCFFSVKFVQCVQLRSALEFVAVVCSECVFLFVNFLLLTYSRATVQYLNSYF